MSVKSITTKNGSCYIRVGQFSSYRNITETEKAICFRNVWIPKSQSFIKHQYQGAGINVNYIYVKKWLVDQVRGKLEIEDSKIDLGYVIKALGDIQDNFVPDEFSTRMVKRTTKRYIEELYESLNIYLNNLKLNMNHI